jgi:hypothetical protein
VVECLPSICKVLVSLPSTAPQKGGGQNREREDRNRERREGREEGGRGREREREHRPGALLGYAE